MTLLKAYWIFLGAAAMAQESPNDLVTEDILLSSGDSTAPARRRIPVGLDGTWKASTTFGGDMDEPGRKEFKLTIEAEFLGDYVRMDVTREMKAFGSHKTIETCENRVSEGKKYSNGVTSLSLGKIGGPDRKIYGSCVDAFKSIGLNIASIEHDSKRNQLRTYLYYTDGSPNWQRELDLEKERKSGPSLGAMRPFGAMPASQERPNLGSTNHCKGYPCRCKDKSSSCITYESQGYCHKYPAFMRDMCQCWCPTGTNHGQAPAPTLGSAGSAQIGNMRGNLVMATGTPNLGAPRKAKTAKTAKNTNISDGKYNTCPWGCAHLLCPAMCVRGECLCMGR